MEDMNCKFWKESSEYYDLVQRKYVPSSSGTNTTVRYWNCTWDSISGVKVPGKTYADTAGIVAHVSDIVGHSVVNDSLVDFPVYLISESTGKHVGVDILEDSIIPVHINRRIISVAPYNLKVPYSVLRNDGQDASLFVLHQMMDDCEIVKTEISGESLYVASEFDDLFYTPIPRTSSNSVIGNILSSSSAKYNMKRSLNENDYVNSIRWLNFSCRLNVYLAYRSNGMNYVYDLPDEVDFNWSITLKDTLNEPGAKVMEKIQDLNETASNLAFLYPTLTFLQTAQGVCNFVDNAKNILYPLSDVTSALKGANALLAWSNPRGTDGTVLIPGAKVPVVGDIENILYTSSQTLDGIVTKFQNFIDDSMFKVWQYDAASENGETPKEKEGAIAVLCNFVRCTKCGQEGNNWLTDMGAGATENFLTGSNSLDIDFTMGGVLNANPGAADWRESMLVSIGCYCVPGVVMKLEEHRQMVCRQMTCLRDKASLGLDISECETEFAQEECKYIMGELGQIGPMRVLDAYFSSAPDPNTLAKRLTIGLVTDLACKEKSDEPVLGALQWVGCEMPKQANMLFDIGNRTVSLVTGGFDKALSEAGDYLSNYVNSWGGLKSSFQYSRDDCAEWVKAPRLGIPQEWMDKELISSEEE
jgi:hypothetical protein